MENESPPAESPQKADLEKSGSSAGWLLLLAVAAGLALAGSTLPLEEPLKSLDNFISELGPWAPAIYILSLIHI